MPNVSCSNPVKSAAVKTVCKYISGSSSGETFPRMLEASSKEAAATVPTAKFLELPKTAYTNGGTKLESATTIHHSISYKETIRLKSKQTRIWYKETTEADDGGNIGELGVADALRDSKASNGYAGK